MPTLNIFKNSPSRIPCFPNILPYFHSYGRDLLRFLLGQLLLTFHLDIDAGHYKCAFLPRKSQKLTWPTVKLVEDEVGVIRLSIVPLDQFFASSTSSSMVLNPDNR